MKQSEELVKQLLKAIGENPEREGLLNTPKRVVKSWNTIFGGYHQDPEKVLKTTFHIDCDEMVIYGGRSCSK